MEDALRERLGFWDETLRMKRVELKKKTDMTRFMLLSAAVYIYFSVIFISVVLSFSAPILAHVSMVRAETGDVLSIPQLVESQEMDYMGYIVEFKEDPVLVKKKLLEEQIPPKQKLGKEVDSQITGELALYRSKLDKEHKDAVKDIEQKLSKKPQKLGEYYNVFNGVALDLTDEEADKIKKSSYVEAVYPNYVMHLLLEDAVPLLNVDDVWSLTDEQGRKVTGKGIVVSVIDTGVDYTHPDLGGCTTEEFTSGNCPKFLGGYDFVNDDSDPMDTAGHGTAVAGIIAANGAVKGVAPDAKLYAFACHYFGGVSSSCVLSSVDRSVDPNQDGDFSDHVDVISMSVGGGVTALSESISNAIDAGVVVVIGAGNSGPETGDSYCRSTLDKSGGSYSICFPGSIEEVITVGASKEDGMSIMSFSSRGPVDMGAWTLIKPDVLAPGEKIHTTSLGGGYTSFAGTSGATPFVSGVAALLLQKHPDMSPADIKKMLQLGAVSLGLGITDQGHGRVDAYKSINTGLQPGVTLHGYVMTDNLNGDGFINPGETLQLSTILSSWGSSGSVVVELETSDACVSMGKDTHNFGSVGSYSFVDNSADPFVFTVDSSCEVGKVIYFTVDVTAGAYEYSYLLGLPVYLPTLVADSEILSPVIADIDGDGDLEIIGGTIGGSLYVWHHKTNIASGWSKKLDASFPVYASVGDIAGDTKLEMVAVQIYTGSPKKSKVYVYDLYGSLLWAKNVDGYIPVNSYPMIGDVDDDGYNEVVVSTYSPEKSYIWRGDGTLIKSLDGRSSAMGDLDNDGDLEILTYGVDGTKPFHHDGSVVNGWPQAFTGYIILGDVNADGYLEVVVGGSEFHVYSPDGSLLSSWMAPEAINPPVLGDLDGDGDLEIMASSSYGVEGDKYIRAWHHTGVSVSNWPVSHFRVRQFSSPVVGDLNNLNTPDVLVGNTFDDEFPSSPLYDKGGLLAWDSGGNLLTDFIPPDYNYITNYKMSGASSLAVGDLDGDGKLDVVISTETNVAYLIELSTLFDESKMEWPMFRHDPQHTNAYPLQPSTTTLEVQLMGDYNSESEYSSISVEGTSLGDACVSGCGQCSGTYDLGLTSSIDTNTYCGDGKLEINFADNSGVNCCCYAKHKACINGKCCETQCTTYGCNNKITFNCADWSCITTPTTTTTISTTTTTTTTPLGYCSSMGGTYIYTHIVKVALNTGSQSSAGSSYSDYTGSVLTSLVRGQSYTLYVDGKSTGPYTEYVKAWIDFNNDGDFYDSGEEINLGFYSFSTGGTHTFSKTFTVPSTAVLGGTRMRVSLRYGSAPVSCGTFTYGEVEDYTIGITSSGTTTTTTATTTTTTATTTTTLVESYCSSNSQYYTYEYVGKVALNTGSKSSVGSKYSDYTGSVFTSLSAGKSYTLYVDGKTTGTYSEYVKAWIDFNHDNDFTDPGEEIDLGSYTFSGTHTYSKAFTVPSNAVLGKTRMRVSLKYGTASVSCGTFAYGEVEDYTIEITGSTPTTISTTTTTTTTTTTLPAYCSSNSQYYTYEYIGRVALNTGSKSSVGSKYSDYTGSVFTSLSAGKSYTLYVDGKTSGTYKEYVKAWIDFNHDNDFADAGEEIDLGSYTFSGTHTYSKAFTVPSNAVLGQTRMRVSLRFYYAPTSCGTFPYGEVEDYTVKIV